MSSTLVKRITFVMVALLLISGAMMMSGCATDAPITVNFVTLGGSGALPEVTVGQSYSAIIQAAGVSGPPTGVYNYALASGSLPSGITLQTVNVLGTNDISNAVISGKDLNANDSGKTFSFTLTATDTEKPAHTGTSGTYTITVK